MIFLSFTIDIEIVHLSVMLQTHLAVPKRFACEDSLEHRENNNHWNITRNLNQTINFQFRSTKRMNLQTTSLRRDCFHLRNGLVFVQFHCCLLG